MWDVNLMAATRTIEKTMPLVLYRLLVCLGLALGYILSILVGAGTGFAIGSMVGAPGIVANLGAIAGIALCVWAVYRFRGSFLQAVTASQLSGFLALREGTSLPGGIALVDHAKAEATARFPSATELATLEDDLRNALYAVPALVWDTSKCLPVRHPRALQAINAVLGLVAASADKMVLAATLHRADEPPRQAAASAVAASAAQWSALYRNLAWLYGFMYSGWLIALLLIYRPVASAAAALPTATGVWPFLFALLLSWVVKAAFFEPIATAALVDYYFTKINGQPADPACLAKLSNDPAYRRLRES